MTIHRVQPDGLMPAHLYSHVVSAEGRQIIYLAGQVATNHEGELVGGIDLAAQTCQVYRNLRTALEAVGAGFEHLVKITSYVVGYQPEHALILGAIRLEFFGKSQLPASTLVGVVALADPAFLIEMEAIAVL